MLPLLQQPDLQVQEGDLSQLTRLGSSLDKAKKIDPNNLEKAAKEFETFMLSHMYKSMYNSIQKSGFSGNGFAQDVFMGMFIDESTKLAAMGDRGISGMMLKQYGQKQGARPLSDLEKIDASASDPTMRMSDRIAEIAGTKNGVATTQNVFSELAAMTDKLSHKITSDFGMRDHPIHKVEKFHHGIDYALPMGTELAAPAAGTVRFAGNRGGYGRTVILDHGDGVETVYAHLSEMDVKEGATVAKGALIGKVGSSGMSTGPHLHFEVRHNGRPVDPKRLQSLEFTAKAETGR